MVEKLTYIGEKLLIDNSTLDFLPPTYLPYASFALIFAISIVTAILLTPWIGKIAYYFGIVNQTKEDLDRETLNKHDNLERRINPNRTALLGGLAVLIPFVLALVLIIGLNSVTVAIAVAVVILSISGTLDDIYNLPATTQLTLQIVAAGVIALSPINLQLINLPFIATLNLDQYVYQATLAGFQMEFLVFGDLLLIFWILTCINAVKWTGGVDALMEGNLIITFLLFFILAARTNDMLTQSMAIILAGTVIGFTVFNAPPAKIFSGSVGKTNFGFLVAVLAVISEAKMAAAILVLLLPLVDFIFVLFKRLLTYKPKGFIDYLVTPFKLMRMPDTNHLHHQLLKLNLSVKQVIFIEASITLFIGSIAIMTTDAFRFLLIFMAGGMLFLCILLVHMLASRRSGAAVKAEKKEESPESKYSY